MIKDKIQEREEKLWVKWEKNQGRNEYKKGGKKGVGERIRKIDELKR